MSLELRTETGILIATFSGTAANQILHAAASDGSGHWRSYRTADMEYPIEVFNIDRPFEFGKENVHGRMAIQVFTDYILIEVN